ncbi:MAG: DUF1015 domain-containing protein [Candidatus Hydrothermarchaeota archaeon]|nr:DUF1015 domain-containing protein [Candidatus Hydrothermarchaeota archaeon]
MAEIMPFRGIRYSTGDLAKVVAPPYDVISGEERDEYYSAHENNAVRLILGKEFPGDDPKNNRYTRAGEYLEIWIKSGVLKQDREPSIYVYEQEYCYGGEKKILRGFIALVRIEEGAILPHEETLSKHIEDRLKLMRATNANLCPIYALYSDENKTLEPALEVKQPAVDVKFDDTCDSKRVRHRLWKVSDAAAIKKVKKEMKDKKLFIADGHHRYKTALAFRNEMRRKKSRMHDYVMMFLTNMDSGGITILPAHRVARISNASKLENKIRRYFDSKVLKFGRKNKNTKIKEMLEELERQDSKHIFGMYSGGSEFRLLTLKDEKILDRIIKGKSREWKRLDVAILHALLLSREKKIRYVINEKKAIQVIDEGRYDIAFFLNPTKVEQVKKIALANERMPGKATYFYPKLLTGLVLNKIN